MKKLFAFVAIVTAVLAVATAGEALAVSRQAARKAQPATVDECIALWESEDVTEAGAGWSAETGEDQLDGTNQSPERVSSPLVLRRLSGETVHRAGGLWVVDDDDTVVVWLDLPHHERLAGEFWASYPYQVADGERGTIEVMYRDWRNNFCIHEKLQFVADGDLTLEHGVPDVDTSYTDCGKVEFRNGSLVSTDRETSLAYREDESMALTYGCFALNTSSGNSPHRQDSVDVSPYCSVRYHIAAVGDFDPALYDTPRCATCHNDLARKLCNICQANPELQP